jgi:hypothetical protein
MKRRYVPLLVLLVSFFTTATAGAFDHRHGLFDILLKKHVVMKDGGKSSRVDYKGIAGDKALMTAYLSDLSSVSKAEYDSWTADKKLAFLINAYNAFTIDLIVRHYPVKSIKDTGSLFKSPWSVAFIPLLGKKRSLDEIEHEMIRKKGVFDEPRIHVALVCASIGCPALRNEAYSYENLNAQLEKAMVLFLSDRFRNRYSAKDRKITVSPIFNWYGQDFKSKYGSLEKFFMNYAKALTDSEGDAADMKKGGFSIDFGDYNWMLNDR